MLGDSVNPIFDAGLVQLVELDHVISSGIRLTPSIDHTPGHVSLMTESEAERAVITGDKTHHHCQMAHPDWLIGDNAPRAAALTRSCLASNGPVSGFSSSAPSSPPAPPATSFVTAQRSVLRYEGGEPHSRRYGRRSLS